MPSFLKSGNHLTVLITGGSSGIGLALAKRFQKLNHKVIISSNNKSQLKEVKLEFPQIQTLYGDISSDKGRVHLVEDALRDFPSLNVLISNAGITHFGGKFPTFLKDTKEEHWKLHREMIEVNFMASVHLSTLLLPHLLTKPVGAIINTSSITAFTPFAHVPTYSASKGKPQVATDTVNLTICLNSGAA